MTFKIKLNFLIQRYIYDEIIMKIRSRYAVFFSQISQILKKITYLAVLKNPANISGFGSTRG